ncbi:MAG TPA: NUDIX hydrolase [Chitinophagaceae bacterium]|nr:NUDIX hydrolase [Chitinophagaceae bacterium]HQV85195.1 NUDIX hydrolase [Chitinophagaceae bacterium]HQX71289.1 NUDIX hydrolase [Chitinophagaceae bacterium]HQZ74148.1 NUDIX hydrolase [Chitinophagaceae bacterium]
MKWKTLSSEYLFNDRWFKVRRDKCETPGGKIVDPYYVYEFSTWVGALPVTEEGKIIMVRQYRHALGETCLEIPGGCVDDTDTNVEYAIARELLEETGYSFTSFDYLGKISPNPSTNSNLLHMFLAKGGKKVGEQNLDENEEIEVVEMTLDELKQLLRENKIVQAMHVSCILYALEKLGELHY